MPKVSVTTTAITAVFSGSVDLQSLSFKNSSATGTIYLKNLSNSTDVVTSSSYDFSLTAGQSVGFTRLLDGAGTMETSWSAISDTGGGVNLDILPVYSTLRVH